MAVDEMVIKFGIDSSNFEGGLTKINSGMKLLQSEFKASSQGLKALGMIHKNLQIKVNT